MCSSIVKPACEEGKGVREIRKTGGKWQYHGSNSWMIDSNLMTAKSLEQNPATHASVRTVNLNNVCRPSDLANCALATSLLFAWTAIASVGVLRLNWFDDTGRADYLDSADQIGSILYVNHLFLRTRWSVINDKGDKDFFQRCVCGTGWPSAIYWIHNLVQFSSQEMANPTSKLSNSMIPIFSSWINSVATGFFKLKVLID